MQPTEPTLTSGDSSDRIGAWIISLGNAIENGDLLVRDDLDSIHLAAKAARFYSAIRSLTSLDGQRLDAYRGEGGLTRFELNGVLESLKRSGAIEIQRGNDERIHRISIKQTDVPGIYEFAAAFFEEQEPSDCCRVAIGILDATIELPLRYDTLVQTVTQGFGVDERTLGFALKHLEVIGALQITQEKDRGQRVVYNPLQFACTDADTIKLLGSLGNAERDRVLLIVKYVKENPGVPLPASFRGPAYDVMKRCGIIDVSTYAPKVGEAVHEFPTLQTTWGRVQYADGGAASVDLVHDAKALLASIRYGELFAERWGGKIKSPYALLGALLRRGSVGPATNIGSDYPLIARRGIINIVENPASPGRYSMELVKADVVRPVLDIIRHDDDADVGDLAQTVAEGAYLFSPPEVGRHRALSEEISVLRDEIVFEQLVRRPRGGVR